MERRHLPVPAAPAELRADELWDALGRLDDRRRAAIVLRFYDDLPDETIAKILGCRPATVRTALHRRLKALRREITPCATPTSPSSTSLAGSPATARRTSPTVPRASSSRSPPCGPSCLPPDHTAT